MDFFKKKEEKKGIESLLSKKKYHLSQDEIGYGRSGEKKEKKIDDNLKLILIGGGIFLFIIIVLVVFIVLNKPTLKEIATDYGGGTGECNSDWDCDDYEISTFDECLEEICVFTTITDCIHGDGFCPEGCFTDADIDCEGYEECSYDFDCDDNDPSTKNKCSLEARKCSYEAITECTDFDNFCPAGCSYENDNDCSTGDECAGDFECDDQDASTKDECSGTPRKCSHITITICEGLDGYCPPGCSISNDIDCDETSCLDDEDCLDDDFSTKDVCKGKPKRCSHTKIIQCKNLDNYCPPGCTYETDKDCEPNHECTLDSDCEDEKASTKDICDDSAPQRKCRYETITSCEDEDGFCPPGCLYFNDNDCLDPNAAIKSGTFSGFSGVIVYGDISVQNSTGALSLNFGSNFHTDSAPEIHVYIVKKSDVSSPADLTVGFSELGVLTSRNGAQSYALPLDIDINKYHSVALYDVVFDVVLGSANIA